MAKYLRKEDAVFILYKKLYDDDFYYTIRITSKYGGNFYKTWIDFKKEIEELSITPYENEWLCEDPLYKNRIVLKNELQKRGFNVVLGDYYEN